MRLHGARQQQGCTFISVLHCDLVRETYVLNLGVGHRIRAKSWYQLFTGIQFLKLLNRNVRGRFSLGQSLQVIALGQKDTFPPRASAGENRVTTPSLLRGACPLRFVGTTNRFHFCCFARTVHPVQACSVHISQPLPGCISQQWGGSVLGAVEGHPAAAASSTRQL